ncbi:MAG: hypothetical protein PHU34_09380 [Candidatus Methanoperedens sp.]|nr:hypothetical protein [Candidatus Methanoperedens sp.]
MISNEMPEAKAERLAEDRAEEEYHHERRQWEELRRIYRLSEDALNRFMSNPTLLPLSKRPKSGKMKAFHVDFEVPEEYWTAMSKGLGFTEADLPGVFAENFCQLADQAPEQNDLPDMLAGSIRDISEQVGHGARESREMSNFDPLS